MSEFLYCGRQVMCTPCKQIEHDTESRKDVCIAVGTVSMRLDAPTLSEEAIQDLTYGIMAGIADEGDYVTREMREVATESTKELILERII